MKTYRFLIIILIAVSIQACRQFEPQIELKIKNYVETDKAAVLDFSVKGLHLSKTQGGFVADRLTAKLFEASKVQVTDRALVKDAQRIFMINSATPFPAEILQKTGKKLNAKYIIIGDVYETGTGEAYTDDYIGLLQISFRIINASTGEIIGFVSHKGSMENKSFEETVENMFAEIFLKMKEVK